MNESFRRIFFPTEEETKKQLELIKSIQEEDHAFWISTGLTESEYTFLKELESQECSELRGFQGYAFRRQLLEMNIVTMEKIRADIKRWVTQQVTLAK